MAWTDWEDDQPRCPGVHGPVGCAETVAKLLHTTIAPPEHSPFKRTEIFPDPKKEISNTCGESSGSSVIRCSSLTHDELRDRAQTQAARRPGRDQQGALVALVSELRTISVSEQSEQQVFVYDDANADEPLHAVIRGRAHIDRPTQSAILAAIQAIFAKYQVERH